MIDVVGHVDVSADGIVKAAPGAVVSIILTAAAADATLILYDNASAASGTVLADMAAAATTSSTFTPPTAWAASLGIYADIGGAGANATVLYI